MKAKRKMLSLLLCATMVFSAYSGVEACVHAHEAESPVAGTPQASFSDFVGTEEQIEAKTCAFAEGGHHELASVSSVYEHPDGHLMRANQNEKYYEASCTHVSGKSSQRPCKYCYTWFTVTVDDGVEAARNHTFDPAKTKQSTCDNETYVTEECSVCGFVKVITQSGKPVNLEDHKRQMVEQVNHGDCETDNVEITKCEDCGVIIKCESKGPKGHRVVTRTETNGTCQQDGLQVSRCYDCEFIKETVLKTKDNHTYTLKEKKATCIAEGSKKWTCLWCGAVDPKHPTEETTGKVEHVWENVENTACTDYTIRRCKVCKQEERQGTGTETHDWSEEKTEPATCSQAGVTYKECKKCGTVEVINAEAEPKLEHKFTIKVIKQQATCGAEGKYVLKCSFCQTEDEAVTVIPPTGKHSPAADDGDCRTSVTCSVCAQIVVKGKADHDWTYTSLGDGYGSQKQHRKTCKNQNCRANEIEICSGIDDGNCGTALKCSFCKGTIKFSSFHRAGQMYVPFEDDADTYHIALCANSGCAQPVTSTKERHTYVNGTCTKCEHVHEMQHIPNGKYESDGAHHWQRCTLCGGKTEIAVHSVTAESPYDGDCTQAVSCDICGQTVKPAQQMHTYTGEWSTTRENHYRVCSNPGCEVEERYDHVAVSDHDCTTPIRCRDCNLILVDGAASHSWMAAASGHNENEHQLVCSNTDCNETKMEAHTAGIAANCHEKAECSICHTKFGDVNPDNHEGNEEIRNEKEATEEQEGYTGDIYCLGCQQIKQSGSTIPKASSHTHEYTKFYYDDTAHTPECAICGHLNEDERSDHVWGAWTILPDGEGHKRSCSVCGSEQRGSHEHGEAVADCTADITCVTCSAVIVEGKEQHQFNGRAEAVDDGHVVACTNENCRVTSSAVPHTGGEATCQSGRHCEVCEAEYGERNPEVHFGGEEIRNHKNPTTAEKGYTGDVYCLGCGTLLTTGEDIDRLPEEHTHTFGNWKSDAANHWKECDCGVIENKGAHQYEKGVCLVCGAKDPSYSGDPGILVDPDNQIEAEFPPDRTEFYKDVLLEVDKLTSSDEDYADVLNTVGKKYDIFVPFDIRLFDTTTGQNIQPSGSLTIKIPVPEGWVVDKTLVYHVNGSAMEQVAATVSQNGKYVTFTVDHLSLYVLVNAESEKKDNPSDPDKTDKTALNEAITAAKALKKADYTAETWKQLTDALAEAEKIAGDTTALQEQIDKATENLNAAVKALEKAKQDNPQTGDNTPLFLWFTLAGLSAAGFVGLSLTEFLRRRRGKHSR